MKLPNSAGAKIRSASRGIARCIYPQRGCKHHAGKQNSKPFARHVDSRDAWHFCLLCKGTGSLQSDRPAHKPTICCRNHEARSASAVAFRLHARTANSASRPTQWRIVENRRSRDPLSVRSISRSAVVAVAASRGSFLVCLVLLAHLRLVTAGLRGEGAAQQGRSTRPAP